MEELAVTRKSFWRILLSIISLEVIMCQVQGYINIYCRVVGFFVCFFFCYWVSLVIQWPMYECFCIPVNACLLFHRRKYLVLIVLQCSLTKKHSHEIIDCAGELQMLRHYQGHLTHQCQLPCNRSVLFRNGAIAKWLNRNIVQVFSIWNGHVLRERWYIETNTILTGKKLMTPYGW